MASTSSPPGVWNISMATGGHGIFVEPPLESLPLYKISNYIWYIASPIILILGNFGNIMTIIIMQKMRSGELVVNTYFTGLAIVDLVTLDIYLLGEWIEITFSFGVKSTHSVVCKIYIWIAAGSATVSAWFLVCLTIHRAMSVVWPHRVNLMCTRRRVFVLLLGIFGFFSVFYSHYLYGYGLVYRDHFSRFYCAVTTASYAKFMEEVVTYIDIVLYSLLPFTCLIIANGVLVWKLKTSVRETGHKLAQGATDQTEARQRTTRSVTLTVIMVSVAFIALTLPASLIYPLFLVAVLTNRLSVHKLAEVYAINSVVYSLMFLNNAVNFYLYCLTGKRFREEFIKTIRCRKASRPAGP